MLVLGIDVGTTGAKAAVFDSFGDIKGYAFQEYDIICPRPGLAEQDGESIWSAAKNVIKLAANGIGHEIKALSISVQGDAIIPIDKHRNALSYAHLGMDYRGTMEVQEIESALGSYHIFQKTGMRPHPMNSLIKMVWIKKHDPMLYEKTYKFTTYADFILGKLGSTQMVIDYTMASRTMAFDLRSKCWSADILNTCDISTEKLSIPVPSGSVVGTLLPALAEELNLSPDIALVAGGHDQTCAALGAGIAWENIALDSHGTAEVISTAFSAPHLEQQMHDSYYPCYLHTVADMYFTFSLNHTGGVSLKWFVDNFCSEDKATARDKSEQVYDYLFHQFSDQPSPLLVLPYFNGSGTPNCDLDMKGAFLGLTLATTRADIAKAIIESLSYELKINLETMKKCGIQIDSLRCVGGGARSPIGLQNKADILGIPVSTLKTREAACLGSAMLAGLAVGMFKDYEHAVSLVKIDKTYRPNDAVHKLYMEKYSTYTALYDIIKPTLHRI